MDISPTPSLLGAVFGAGAPQGPAPGFAEAAGLAGLAPPGPEPPPMAFNAILGEEGATLEPIAPPQNPDFSPQASLRPSSDEDPSSLQSFEVSEKPSPAEAPPLAHPLPEFAALSALSALMPIAIPIEPEALASQSPLIGPSQTVAMEPAQGEVPTTASVRLEPSPHAPAPTSDAPTHATASVPTSFEIQGKPEPAAKMAVEPTSKPVASSGGDLPIGRGGDSEPQPAGGVEKLPRANQPAAHSAVQSIAVAAAAPRPPEGTKSNSKADVKDAKVEAAKGGAGKVENATSKPKDKSSERKDGDGAPGPVPAASKESNKTPEPTEAAPSKPARKIELTSSDEGPVPADAKVAEGRRPEAGHDIRPQPSTEVFKAAEAKLSPRQTEALVRQLADRVEALAVSSPRHNVTIHLDPKEFGSVTLIVRGTGKEIEAEIFAAHDGVRRAVESGSGDLRQSLESRGIHLGGLSVGSEAFQGRARQEAPESQFFHAPRPDVRMEQPQPWSLTLDDRRRIIRKETGVDLWI